MTESQSNLVSFHLYNISGSLVKIGMDKSIVLTPGTFRLM